jgi:hypothetical protein
MRSPRDDDHREKEYQHTDPPELGRQKTEKKQETQRSPDDDGLFARWPRFDPVADIVDTKATRNARNQKRRGIAACDLNRSERASQD